MSDIIKLLPDSVANQIAAGEVIQRPASAIKELLENAIDAGASHIDIILKDAGKTLIHIIDNGCGMSETDARMSFERHATSKISKADDLFSIRTMGFRGEALASIAAIAQVEMKTRRHEDEFGSELHIEGSLVTKQEVCSCPAGTQIAIKNLFFNVPARRNFLKSPPAEMRHIIEEFQRVSLIHPEIGFRLTHNDKEMFQLFASGLKQRIVALFGNLYNERLLPVGQKTELVSVDGFIGKAEFARKTRGEQYFFVNKRFIKHHYLHHAVENAFQELLPRDSFPSYFLHISIDPAEIDINIHPTKTEVNFQDTKLVYAIIQAAVKKSLGQHNLSPMLDFDASTDHGIDFGEISRANREVRMPSIAVNTSFNPFSNSNTISQRSPDQKTHSSKETTENWRIFYEQTEHHKNAVVPDDDTIEQSQLNNNQEFQFKFLQVHGQFILTPVKSGLMLIDQHLAHWRVLFEKYIKQLENKRVASQQELFPQTLQFSASDSELLEELMSEFHYLGFAFEQMGKRVFILTGTPEGFAGCDATKLIESVIENYKENTSEVRIDKKNTLAKAFSANMAIRYGQKLSEPEMSALVDQLFACQIAEVAPNGKKIVNVLTLNDLSTFLK